MPIHPTAIVHDAARIDPGATIGPYAVIDGPVRIGPDVRVGPHVHITGATEIGAGCRIHAGAVLGDAPQDRAYDGWETFCRIGSDTIIREHVTVHRGTDPGSTTVVGSRCFLMAGAHVGHNSSVGDDVVLANVALLGGHVHVGDGAFLGGGAAVHQFVRIGSRAMIAGNSRALRDIPPFMITNADGHIAGVNVIGMRRGQFTSAEREEVKQAYRLLYRSGMHFRNAVEQLAGTVQTAAAREILSFVTAESKRGFAQRARGEPAADSADSG
jgi:UDP-N-acetylglucosamine acyltransferase